VPTRNPPPKEGPAPLPAVQWLLRIVLAPFSLLWYVGSSLLHHLYNIGYKPSVQFEVPVICVGNLAVGGTGKTPMVEYLLRLLAGQYRLATLSRGYGRRTRSIRLAQSDDTAETLGDEPYQFYTRFGQQVTVAVGEERLLAIPTILNEKPDTQVVVLDDAYQHRKVQPYYTLLLTTYERPFFQDVVLPGGRLREARRGAQRAHAVVVTKCPEGLPEAAMQAYQKRIGRYTKPGTPVYFAGLQYGKPTYFMGSDGQGARFNAQPVVLVSGIAHPQGFDAYARQHFTVVKHFMYADHHRFTSKEVQQVAAAAKAAHAVVLTTEKDSMRLRHPMYGHVMLGVHCFYLPIALYFIKGGKEFDAAIGEIIKQGVKKSM